MWNGKSVVGCAGDEMIESGVFRWKGGSKGNCSTSSSSSSNSKQVVALSLAGDESERQRASREFKSTGAGWGDPPIIALGRPGINSRPSRFECGHARTKRHAMRG